MTRVAALVVLTATFAPVAVMGALPLVIPVVGLLTLGLLLVTPREPAPEPGASRERTVA